MSVYVANTKLYVTSTGAIGISGSPLAFNTGDIVPDATVTRDGLVAAGLVTSVAGTSPVSVYPVTLVQDPAGALSDGVVPEWDTTTSKWIPGTALSSTAANATYSPKLAEQTITSAPTSAGTDDRTLILGSPADWSQVYSAQRLTVSGASTFGTPASGYEYSYETTPHFLIFDAGNAGHNESTSTNAGRTGATAYRTMVYNGGAGDVVAYNAYVEIYTPTNAGLSHWLADAAGVIINGDVSVTNGAHHYLNPLEFNLSDGGQDTACIGTVLNLNRTVGTAGRGEVWIGHRVQGSATSAVDVGYSIGSIPLKRGIDLSQPTYDSDKAAVTLAQDQRIYLKATTAAINGVNWYATTVGTAWLDYNSTLTGVEIVSNSGVGLLVGAAASAVNYIKVNGQATGIGPQLSATGSDTNVSMLLETKGTGAFNFRTNSGTTQFYVDHFPSATRFVKVAGSTDAPAVQTSAGDLNLDPATGKVRMSNTQILTTRQTGWTAATGTPTRTTFATGSVTLPQLAERVKALIDDLITHGLIGT